MRCCSFKNGDYLFNPGQIQALDVEKAAELQDQLNAYMAGK